MLEDERVIPIRGKPKSGRVWKNDKNRFSSMCQVKPLKSSWEKKVKIREEQKAMKLHALRIKEEKEKEEQLRKQRRKAKIERQKENERKAEIVQVIKNSAKIKRMSKKQLRTIEKRDTNPTNT
ncbi:coiled-coil domain-containing protein 86 [Parasteatoda tepidariorum]|nr:coiled-coil domain-containing protein 86 [Parasteatoda tepidariorum]